MGRCTLGRISTLAITVLIMAVFLSPLSVGAALQSEPIILAEPSRPVDPDLSAQIVALLQDAPPAETNIYAITNVRQMGGSYLVSLVGLVNLEPPYIGWRLEDGNAIWLGVYTVHADGSGGPWQPISWQPANYPKYLLGSILAIPFSPEWLEPEPFVGGGPTIQFPFQTGTSAVYGSRGVHGDGDYGTSGMLAVDFVGGDSFGSNVMPPLVYASESGTIDYVCDDGTSVAVRIGDYLYAHLAANASLAISESFGTGQLLGALVYGSFSDTCGWASQGPDVYHIHFMFTHSDGGFQAEGCVLNVSTQMWTCGEDEIGTGGWITAGGANSGWLSVDPDDPAGSITSMPGSSFWDSVVIGVLTGVDGTLGAFLPTAAGGGEGFDAFAAGKNAVIEYTNIGYVLLGGNMNMGIILGTATLVVASEIVKFVLLIMRYLKKFSPMP